MYKAMATPRAPLELVQPEEPVDYADDGVTATPVADAGSSSTDGSATGAAEATPAPSVMQSLERGIRELVRKRLDYSSPTLQRPHSVNGNSNTTSSNSRRQRGRNHSTSSSSTASAVTSPTSARKRGRHPKRAVSHASPALSRYKVMLLCVKGTNRLSRVQSLTPCDPTLDQTSGKPQR